MDRQTAIDRITETENLTDGLEDDDANWLLDWGIAQVDGLVTGIKDEDAAGEKLNQLMSVMRTLNQIAADRAAKPPDALAGDIRTFLERYQQAFGAPKSRARSNANCEPDAISTARATHSPDAAPKDSAGSWRVSLHNSSSDESGGISRNRRRRAVSRQRPRQIRPPRRRTRRPRRPPTSPSPASPSSATAPSSATPPANAATKRLRPARRQIKWRRRRARSRGWLQKRLCNISSRWRRRARLRHNGHTSCVWLFALVRLFRRV